MERGLAAGMLCIAASIAAAQDWPQWRGPSRDGVPAGFGPAAWPGTLRKAWQVPVGSGHASPVVGGERVYLFFRQDDAEVVAALDLASGRELWRQSYPAPYSINPAAFAHGKGPKATPVLQGGRLFTLGIGGILSRFEAATGRPVWRKEVPFTTEYDQNAVTPAVDGDVVIYSGLDKGVHAVRIVRSGADMSAQPAWQNTEVSLYLASPVMVGGRLYGISHRRKGQFFALDARNGRTLWLSDGRQGDSAAIAAAGQHVLFLTTEGRLSVVRADAASFAPVATYTVAESPTWAQPALTDRALLVKDALHLPLWRLE